MAPTHSSPRHSRAAVPLGTAAWVADRSGPTDESATRAREVLITSKAFPLKPVGRRRIAVRSARGHCRPSRSRGRGGSLDWNGTRGWRRAWRRRRRIGCGGCNAGQPWLARPDPVEFSRSPGKEFVRLHRIRQTKPLTRRKRVGHRYSPGQVRSDGPVTRRDFCALAV